MRNIRTFFGCSVLLTVQLLCTSALSKIVSSKSLDASKAPFELGTRTHNGLTLVRCYTSSVESLVLVSSDKASMELILKKFRFGMPFEDLKATTQDERYSVSSWGQSGAVIVDRSSGPIEIG